jgi:hypothetical protein
MKKTETIPVKSQAFFHAFPPQTGRGTSHQSMQDSWRINKKLPSAKSQRFIVRT